MADNRKVPNAFEASQAYFLHLLKISHDAKKSVGITANSCPTVFLVAQQYFLKINSQNKPVMPQKRLVLYGYLPPDLKNLLLIN